MPRQAGPEAPSASTVSSVPGRKRQALSCICFHGNKENTGFVWSEHEALIQGVAPGEGCGGPLWPGPPDSRGFMETSRAGWRSQTWFVTGSMAVAAGGMLDGAVGVDLKLERCQGAPQQAAPPGGPDIPPCGMSA